jgi:hypothetical protein
MEPLLALLPSPLLGPAVWRPVADLLIANGRQVVVPPAAPTAPATATDALHAFLDALPADRSLILVPHSNAGLFVPRICAARTVTGYVFVDAGLPGDDPVPLAPPAFRDFLSGLADPDGLLPPWTRWWDEADVAPLFPNDKTRREVEREQRRLPLAYFSGALPATPGWATRPGGYVAFGDTYADDRARAAERGWPVTTLSGGHLHTLTDPVGVAAQIEALLVRLGLG